MEKVLFHETDRIRCLVNIDRTANSPVAEIGYGRSKTQKRYVLVRDVHLLQFVYNGKGTLNGASFEKGALLYIRPGEVEVREPDSDDPYSCAWIALRGEEAEQLLTPLKLPPVGNVLPFPRTHTAADLLRRAVEDAWKDTALHHDFWMRGALYSLLALFPRATMPPLPDAVSRAQAYIRLHYNEEDLTVGQVAAFVGVTQNHLCKCFKKQTGQTILATLLDVRLEQAGTLLTQTVFSIGEIASSVGFSDPKHFSQMFKKRYGDTPGGYRKRHLR